jgi:site-specific DNA-methyltransferase (adenine-specific)
MIFHRCPAVAGRDRPEPRRRAFLKRRKTMAKRAYMPQAQTVEWGTPQRFYRRMDTEFHFVLDAAATQENAKCSLFHSLARHNGLTSSWNYGGAVWCNPPYGLGLNKWVVKAYLEAQQMQFPVVMLLPVRSDTAWWHACVMRADEVRLIKGRLKFGGAKAGATFPSCIVVFRNRFDMKGRMCQDGETVPYFTSIER